MTDIAELGRSAANAVLERVGRGVSQMQERTPLAYDILESDDAYLVVFDAPGAESTDVQVRYVDGAVQVRIDRFRSFREGFETRFPGRGLALSGDAELPTDAVVDAAAADATLTDAGELRVVVPKDETTTDVPVGDADGEESDAHDDADADENGEAETDDAAEETDANAADAADDSADPDDSADDEDTDDAAD
ncbi:MAG: Hsp20/alpha crystallin family protein [Halolamina sp.]